MCLFRRLKPLLHRNKRYALLPKCFARLRSLFFTRFHKFTLLSLKMEYRTWICGTYMVPQNRAFKVKVLCNRSLYSSQLSRQQWRDWRFHCEPDKARTVRQAVWGHLKLIDLFSTVNDKCVSQVSLGREQINVLKKVKSKRLKLSYIKQHLKCCVIMTNQCSFLSHYIDGLSFKMCLWNSNFF